MKNMKKILAVALAVMMLAALSVTAMASAPMTGESGVIGEFTNPDDPTIQQKSVVIYKEITAYNPETCTVNAPTFSYNFTIAAGDAGKDIWDVKTAHDPENNAHVVTKAGVGAPTITGTGAGVIALTPADQLNASAKGIANRFPLTIDFSAINFNTAGTGAGVYRYVISETTTVAAKNAAGIKEGDVANTLYLDVYVNGNNQIYGYVLFTNNNSIDARDGATTNTVAEAEKTEGFVGEEPANGEYDSEADSVADKYYTFNFEITKDVVNDNYTETTHHQFPFSVTLDNPNVTAVVLPKMNVGTNAAQAALTAAAIGTGANATNWTPTIADGAVISYVGIPCGTTVTINETNDVVGVTYVSESEKADVNAAEKHINNGEVSNNAIINCTAALTAATENHTAAQSKQIKFTNTLLEISPTGVAFRFAPFMMILAAGMMLFVLSRKSRKVED